MQFPTLLTAREAAPLMDMQPRTLSRRAAAGEGPALPDRPAAPVRRGRHPRAGRRRCEVSAEIQELAAAIRDALDVPIVDTKQGRLFDELMLRTARMAALFGVMETVIDGQVDVPAAIRAIRREIEQAPVTYVPFVDEQPGSGS